MTNKLRAIDLYAGVGGWSLGLKMAGIEVVASYDIWGEANETNFLNNGHPAQTVDLRHLPLEDLPDKIDVVVGSPPCTQFSYANRGGNGDLADGLIDIARFLSVVQHLKPKFWVMENVPRVADVVTEAMKPDGALSEFSELKLFSQTFNMSEFGVPQKRKRCLIANFDLEPIKLFKEKFDNISLGQVVANLSNNPVVDPTYGLSIKRSELTENDQEPCLNEEEVRINRASKVQHHVYNAMKFPDLLEDYSRTITATCTRVSRESVVIQPDPMRDEFRRLSIRERGCLQGFPITYQFYASSHAKKAKMIGNAVPPSFAYLVASLFANKNHMAVKPIKFVNPRPDHEVPSSPITHPDRAGRIYPATRRFRFAIPSLRLKSGVRFELSNFIAGRGPPVWQVKFWFGTPKSIQSIDLHSPQFSCSPNLLGNGVQSDIRSILDEVAEYVEDLEIEGLQRVWSHRGPSKIRPFDLLDAMSQFGADLEAILCRKPNNVREFVNDALIQEFGDELSKLKGINKLLENAPKIAAGLILAPEINKRLRPNNNLKFTKKAGS